MSLCWSDLLVSGFDLLGFRLESLGVLVRRRRGTLTCIVLTAHPSWVVSNTVNADANSLMIIVLFKLSDRLLQQCQIFLLFFVVYSCGCA